MGRWDYAVLTVIENNYGFDTTFTRDHLRDNYIEIIMEKANTRAKKKESIDSSFNRSLRNLTNEGYLKSGVINGKKGTYKLVEMADENQLIHRSKGEALINRILKELSIGKNMKIEEQKIFDDCKSEKGGFLKFDFFITLASDSAGTKSKKIAIEFDGQQHKKSVDRFGGENKLEEQKKNDKIKDDYCKKNNIKMIRINEISYEKAKKYLIDEFKN